LFVLGSFVFAYNIHHIIHEGGHVFSGLVVGAEIYGISSHPFSWSYAAVGEGGNPRFVSWGGLLWSHALALVVFATLYRVRSVRLFPVLLWCSLSFLVAGVYFSVGALAHVGDPATLMAYGTDRYIVLSVGVGSLLVGGALLIVAGGSLDLHRRGYSASATVLTFVLPVYAYLAAMLIYTFFWNADELRLWGMFVMVGAVVSPVVGWLIHRLGPRFAPGRRVEMSRTLVVVANLLGVAVLTAQFTILAE
jgi:hypothetical protein